MMSVNVKIRQRLIFKFDKIMDKLKKQLSRLIIFTDRLVNLYLYFIICACFLSLVPNINPNYPLFKYIFKFAGFYLIPPVLGFSFSPMLIMITLVLISIGLHKIYNKYFRQEESVYIIPAEEFFETIKNQELEINKNLEDNTSDNDDNSNKENN